MFRIHWTEFVLCIIIEIEWTWEKVRINLYVEKFFIENIYAFINIYDLYIYINSNVLEMYLPLFSNEVRNICIFEFMAIVNSTNGKIGHRCVLAGSRNFTKIFYNCHDESWISFTKRNIRFKKDPIVRTISLYRLYLSSVWSQWNTWYEFRPVFDTPCMKE